MIYKTIDLCAGIGGIRRGFELTGRFKNVISAEIDEAACKTYEHLFGDNPRYDLTSEDFKQKVREINYDVLLAGFPCQAFSSVGLQLGFEDTIKGTVFFDIARIIRDTHPKVVFLENVENLIVHKKGQTIQTIIEVLEDHLHYKVIGSTRNAKSEIIINRQAFLRNSRNFGLPQNRPRVYIVAFSREYFGSLVDDLPDMLPTGNDKVIFRSLNEVLDREVSPKYFLSAGYLETLEKHNQRQIDKGYGFGYRIVNLPDVEQPISNTLLATGGSGRERNLIIDNVNGSRYAGMTVEEYVDTFGLKQTVKALRAAGIPVRIGTIRKWFDVDSHQVGVQKQEYFRGIGLATGHTEMSEHPESYYNACKVVNQVRGEILKHIGDGKSEIVKCTVQFATYRRAKPEDCMIPFYPADPKNYIVPPLFQPYVKFDADTGMLKPCVNDLNSGTIRALKEKDVLEGDEFGLIDALYKLSAQLKKGHVRKPHEVSVSLNFSSEQYLDCNKELDETTAKVTALRQSINDETASVTIMLVNDCVDRPDGENCLFQPCISVLFYVGTSRARLMLEIVSELSETDCTEILQSVFEVSGKIKNAKKKICEKLNAVVRTL